MPQHDYSIANQTAPSLRTDLNNSLSAIVSQNSGATAPSTTYANMFWYDTTNDILKMRNETNTAWIELFDLDQGSNLASPSNIASQAEAEAGTNTSKMMTPQRVSQAIDALAPQVLEGWHPYDMVTAGDGADGIFWEGGVDANFSSGGVETPNFVDGYDYAILAKQLSFTSSNLFNANFRFGLYGATTASYFTTYITETSTGRGDPRDYFLEFVTPTRAALKLHAINIIEPTGGGQTKFTTTTAQKIGKILISVSSGNAIVNSGTLALYRRRNYTTG